MKHAPAFLSALAAISRQEVPSSAGIAGPAFPAPASLPGSELLGSAAATFEDIIAKSAIVQPNETAWAVSVFSASDEKPLYEKYFTPEYDVGVAEVNKDSVFRIASVSKVFSVWTFLMEVGDDHFGDPITRYVPELLAVANDSVSGAIYDDIDHVRWDEVTLGQLASHLAGIPRDRE